MQLYSYFTSYEVIMWPESISKILMINMYWVRLKGSYVVARIFFLL